MRKIYLVLLLLTASGSGYSQIEFKKNEVFIELGGNGLLGSINYDRQLTNKPGLGLRVGAGVYGINTRLTIPMGVNYLIRVIKNHSFLDLGFGATYTKSDGFFYASPELPEGYIRKKEFVYLIPSAGLRAYTTKNYVWRITATPFITNDSSVLPYIGFGFGKRF